TFQPAHMFGTPSDPLLGTFLVAGDFVSGTHNLLRVIQVNDPLAVAPAFFPAFVDVGQLYNTAAALPLAPQPGTSVGIDTGDTRMLSAVWRNNSLWATNTINPLSGADAGQATAHFNQIA